MYPEDVPEEQRSTWSSPTLAWSCSCVGCRRARENARKVGGTVGMEGMEPMREITEIERLQVRMEVLEKESQRLRFMYNDFSQCLTDLENQVENMNMSGTLLKGAILQAEPLRIPETYGWICPRCEIVHAPSVLSCYCGDVQAADPEVANQLHTWLG